MKEITNKEIELEELRQRVKALEDDLSQFRVEQLASQLQIKYQAEKRTGIMAA